MELNHIKGFMLLLLVDRRDLLVKFKCSKYILGSYMYSGWYDLMYNTTHVASLEPSAQGNGTETLSTEIVSTLEKEALYVPHSTGFHEDQHEQHLILKYRESTHVRTLCFGNWGN